MGNLYDRADIYDLFENEEKYQAVKKHWETILEGKDVHTFLDVSIGTGSLTLPAAELGVKLYGSDLSVEMLQKCGEKLKKRNLCADLRKCDFRNLTEKFREKFDLVGSTGNSLPHVPNEDLEQALEQMDALTANGGYLYFDMRNWDKILKERNRFYLYNPMFTGDTRVNLVQVWDYFGDDEMAFHLLYTFEKENKIVQKEHFEERYYPIRQKKLLDKLKALGYRNIQIMCHPAYFKDIPADQADWYCIVAQK